MAGNLGACSEGRGQRFESSWVRQFFSVGLFCQNCFSGGDDLFERLCQPVDFCLAQTFENLLFQVESQRHHLTIQGSARLAQDKNMRPAIFAVVLTLNQAACLHGQRGTTDCDLVHARAPPNFKLRRALRFSNDSKQPPFRNFQAKQSLIAFRDHIADKI
jgi:hypothetical protein